MYVELMMFVLTAPTVLMEPPQIVLMVNGAMQKTMVFAPNWSVHLIPTASSPRFALLK
jgi:hypothetical protein